MATIWFLQEGEIQKGPPIATKPLDWCVINLGLRPDSWIAKKNLTVGEKSETGRGPYRGFRFVLVEVNQDDLRIGWKTGFHLLDRDATEVRKGLAEN